MTCGFPSPFPDVISNDGHQSCLQHQNQRKRKGSISGASTPTFFSTLLQSDSIPTIRTQHFQYFMEARVLSHPSFFFYLQS